MGGWVEKSSPAVPSASSMPTWRPDRKRAERVFAEGTVLTPKRRSPAPIKASMSPVQIGDIRCVGRHTGGMIERRPLGTGPCPDPEAPAAPGPRGRLAAELAHAQPDRVPAEQPRTAARRRLGTGPAPAGQ